MKKKDDIRSSSTPVAPSGGVEVSADAAFAELTENFNGMLDFSDLDHESQVLEAEKETILANENQILYAKDTSKFDPRIYTEFHLGSNSCTLDISPGQWI